MLGIGWSYLRIRSRQCLFNPLQRIYIEKQRLWEHNSKTANTKNMNESIVMIHMKEYKFIGIGLVHAC